MGIIKWVYCITKSNNGRNVINDNTSSIYVGVRCMTFTCTRILVNLSSELVVKTVYVVSQVPGLIQQKRYNGTL